MVVLGRGRAKGRQSIEANLADYCANVGYQEHIATPICFAGSGCLCKCRRGDMLVVSDMNHSETVAGIFAYFGARTLRRQRFEKIVRAELGEFLAGRP